MMEKSRIRQLMPGMADKYIETIFRYHNKNGAAYQSFISVATQYKKWGVTKAGSIGIISDMRYIEKVRTEGKSDYHIPSCMGSFYARLLESENPEFEGFFTKKRLGVRTAINEETKESYEVVKSEDSDEWVLADKEKNEDDWESLTD